MPKANMDQGTLGKLLDEDDVYVLRKGVRVLAQAVMDAEMSTHYRPGYRIRAGETRVSTVELRIPKVVPAPASPRSLPRQLPPSSTRLPTTSQYSH